MTYRTEQELWRLARPSGYEPVLQGWAADHPESVRLASRPLYCGRSLWAVVLASGDRPLQERPRLLCLNPHAHEPGATIGQLDFISQTLDGTHLDGTPSELNAKAILEECLVVLIPDGNPDGRTRAGADCWDGSLKSNADFHLEMRGVTGDGYGLLWDREWNTSLYPGVKPGVCYEEIEKGRFVEPNQSTEGSVYKMALHLHRRYAFHAALHLHQTEFEGMDQNVLADDHHGPWIPEWMLSPVEEWAGYLLDRWEQRGARPLKTLYHHEWLARRWREADGARRRLLGDMFCQIGLPSLVSEVQNNNPRTPPEEQRRLNSQAVEFSLEWLKKNVDRFAPYVTAPRSKESVDVKIRRLMMADLPVVHEINRLAWKDVALNHLLERTYGRLGQKAWNELKADSVEACLKARPEFAFVAEVEGQVVGYATYEVNRNTMVGEVTNNAVHPDWHGFGIATRLQQEIRRAMIDAGMKVGHLVTFMQDLPAQSVYRKVGYRPFALTLHMTTRLED